MFGTAEGGRVTFVYVNASDPRMEATIFSRCRIRLSLSAKARPSLVTFSSRPFTCCMLKERCSKGPKGSKETPFAIRFAVPVTSTRLTKAG